MNVLSPSQKGREAGFTLLELLVALSVLGFLMFGLAQGLRFGLTAWTAQLRVASSQGDLDEVDRALRRLVEQIVPTDDIITPAIRGTTAELECITELPVAAALPSRRVLASLGVDRAHRLVLRWVPYPHAQRLGPAPAPQENELLRGIERIELSYFFAEAGGSWLPAWNRREVPNLVRIRFIFPPGDRRHWPDIVAALMQEAPEDF